MSDREDNIFLVEVIPEDNTQERKARFCLGPDVTDV